jgi:hypothetical protein
MHKTYDFHIFLDDWVCQKIKNGIHKTTKKRFKNLTSYEVGNAKDMVTY